MVGYVPLLKTLASWPFDDIYVTRFKFGRAGDEIKWTIMSQADLQLDTPNYTGNIMDSIDDDDDDISTEFVNNRAHAILQKIMNVLQEVRDEELRGSGIKNIVDKTDALNAVKKATVNYILSAMAGNSGQLEDCEDDDDGEALSYMIHHYSRTPFNVWQNEPSLKPIDALRAIAYVSNLGYYDINDIRGGAMTLRSGRIIGIPYNLRPRHRSRAEEMQIARRVANRLIKNKKPKPNRAANSSQENNDNGVDNDGESSVAQYPKSRAELIFQKITRALNRIAMHLRREIDEVEHQSIHVILRRFYERLHDRLDENVDDASLATFLMAWLVNTDILEATYRATKHVVLNCSTYPLKIINQQVIVTGADVNGKKLFTRLWTRKKTSDDSPNTFVNRLLEKMAKDLLAITARVENPITTNDIAEMEEFMQESGYKENSGDIHQVLMQIQAYESLTNINISFRFQVMGRVAFSHNEIINRRHYTWYTTTS